MMRCAKCKRPCRSLSYADSLCRKCDRKAVRTANEQFARAVIQDQQRIEDRQRELMSRRWPGRVVRGLVWGSYDGLRNVVLVFIEFSRIVTPPRGYQRDYGDPRWPGWLWFSLWFALTAAAVTTAYFIWGAAPAVLAFFLSGPTLGAIHGAVRAARNDWDWWLVRDLRSPPQTPGRG